MLRRSARPAKSHIGGTQTFSLSPGYPYADGHFQPRDHGTANRAPDAPRRGIPRSSAQLRTVSCPADAAYRPSRIPDSTRQTICTLVVHTTNVRTAMIVAILDDGNALP